MSSGSIEEFDKNWKDRPEISLHHYVPLVKRVKNQIQFAFRSHFELFLKILDDLKADETNNLNKKRIDELSICELGCGRGTLSAYFSEAGSKVTLVDTSGSVLSQAKQMFAIHKLEATYIKKDIVDFSNKNQKSFDLVFSIGLAEHFSEIEKVIDAHDRVLAKGGVAIIYSVPRESGDIQRKFNWINLMLSYFSKKQNRVVPKEPVFRNELFSHEYLKILNKKKKSAFTTGVYPYPMISTDIKFPFSLLSSKAERLIVFLFCFRRWFKGEKHWMAKNDRFGHGFYVIWSK